MGENKKGNGGLRSEKKLQCDFCFENNKEAHDKASLDIPRP